MRRTAYLKALDEANKLPDDLKELEYFQGQVLIHPRSEVIGRIKTAARHDDKLLHHELMDVLAWDKNHKEFDKNPKTKCESTPARDIE